MVLDLNPSNSVIKRLRCIFLLQAIALIAYVMITELFSAKCRTRPSVGASLFWSSGLMLLALFGYLVRDWRHLEFIISLPNFLTIAFIWYVSYCLVHHIYYSMYSQTSMAWTSLGPWKFVPDMGGWSHWGLIIVPGQEANGDNLGISFPSSIK